MLRLLVWRFVSCLLLDGLCVCVFACQSGTTPCFSLAQDASPSWVCLEGFVVREKLWSDFSLL